MTRTAKSKSKNRSGTVKSCDSSNYSAKQKNDIRKESYNKKLVVDAPKGNVIEEVFHRKSERRRVARDIFLVFEEQSNHRRKTRSNKKQTKPKFGHLKVEDPLRPKALLRDIKNEPKCYLNGNSLSVNATLSDHNPIKRKKPLKRVKKEKNLKSVEGSATNSKTVNTGFSHKTNTVKSLKISSFETQPSSLGNEQRIIARVNPIFLWVKQDNTRIVEVRCEDYDKRNRIRITKTPNGWRAIPRSDPTTSRVIKFYPTPLMKVKRETTHEKSNTNNNKSDNKDIMSCEDFSIPSIYHGCVAEKIDIKLNGNDTVCNPLAFKNIKSKNKKSKKFKKKLRPEKTEETPTTSETCALGVIVNAETRITPFNRTFDTNSSEGVNIPANNITLEPAINKKLVSENNKYTNDLDQNISVHTMERNTEDFKSNSNSNNSSLGIGIPLSKSTYHKHEKEFLHLCPKTGLFLPKHISILEYQNESNVNISELNVSTTAKNCFLTSTREFNNDIEKNNIDSKIQINEENAESLEAKTKNLKDLLDNADLLQNCDDNTNSDADLIDTLVKTSCETNLIQANENVTKTSMALVNQKSLHGTNEMVHLMPDVSDPPKSLSFNEAGEIEGLNGELFQSNTYLETFDKQSSALLTEPQVILHSTTSTVETTASSEKISFCDNIEAIVGNLDINNCNLRQISEIEDSPKDLSYKKREEVCPPSESRNQCAVTSSSDVIKSPQQEETFSLASSSETLKNLILEQLIKLNAINTQNQREPIDVEKQGHCGTSNIKSVYASKSDKSNLIETVIIEDDENASDIEHEEPLKKRFKLSTHKIKQNVGKLTMIDKDPDPLTQLRLLIRNTQWKVPDPILVPKDRLSAVLASPAREIPLLITTRPELRLPEAFAYPEIIQNPNILVISMAQLEAILKNELEVGKTTVKSTKPEINKQLSNSPMNMQLKNSIDDLQLTARSQHIHHTLKQSKNSLTSENSGHSGTSHIDKSETLSEAIHECEKIAQADLSTSDINSATMAMLNQMLWLPYFGQLSQDIRKSIKSPMSSKENCSSIVPLYNTQLNGVSNLEEIVKDTPINKISENAVSNSGFQCLKQQFKASEELSLFQKIVQHQMQSVLQLNHIKYDSSKDMPSVAEQNAVSSNNKSKSKVNSSNVIQENNPKVYLNNNPAYTTVCKNQTNNCDNNLLVQEKSYNLRSAAAGRHSIESKQYSTNNQREITDNKPRLTCKSLSNLLEPEHNMLPSSSSSISLAQNLSSVVKEIKGISTECKVNDSNADSKRQFLCNETIVPPSHITFNNTNISIESSSKINKQTTKTHEIYNSSNDAPALTTDTNVPLWHPLFGSNTKTAYSSPWRWTTVTATGE